MIEDFASEVTPEPTPVYVSYDRCEVHGFFKISMPRNEGEIYDGLPYTCPIKGCYGRANDLAV